VVEQRFSLDRFQREAIAAVDAGRNVLVAAPTGAGKTVVAEHAVADALAQGRRAFYTTPIKALSNQKYADLVRIHGREQVGLLTGDNAVNPGAGVVVMTTEVLRNMLYGASAALDDLAWVVLDEVHYLQDTFRGPVWEEVIIHTPPSVRFVCLSATVSNADELAGWLRATRGETTLVVEHDRPVELVNHFLVHDKIGGDLVRLPTLVGGRPNPEGTKFDAPAPSGPRQEKWQRRTRSRWGIPRRAEMVEHLEGSGLLPAIVFVFSRKGCDEAARSLLAEGRRLTTATERQRIRAIVEHHVRRLDDADLAVLDHDRWLAGLEAGVAAHHAGMVPPFKEAVEACFVEGLVKVVFATETLALGINMPARSVVIEVLSKFTGEHHEDLTPSQYTQLTGRAGRRGLDPVGHALVLWSPWYGFDKVAALAASREFVLRSAFRPTANMVANLVRGYDRDDALELLGRSFGQFQSDQSLDRIDHRRRLRLRQHGEATEAARCSRGDVDEYRDQRAAERLAVREARQGRTDVVAVAADQLAPGDVLRIGVERVAVLSVSYRKGGVRVRVVDRDARLSVLGVDDFDRPPKPAGSISLPAAFDPNDRLLQREVANHLRRVRLTKIRDQDDGDAPGNPEAAQQDVPAAELPVTSCPDLDRHLAAASERDRLGRQIDELDRRLAERSGSLTRRFEQIEKLLTRRGFLRGWELTESGHVLARTFHEHDVLVATVVTEGLLDGLEPAALAGIMSMLTYEHRSKEPPPPPWFPSRSVKDRVQEVERVARELAREEERAGLTASPAPDPSFLGLAHAWAAGDTFAAVVGDEDLSPGDFVRNIKQLIDVLRQVGEVAPEAATRTAARSAAESLFRGVVAASSEVTGGDDPPASRQSANPR
jgi:ATP-dependent RNA helicase HelY